MERKEILDLARELSNQEPKIQTRSKCPWCHKFTLILKEYKSKYKCLCCEREGELKEVKHKYFSDMMTERKGVNI